MGGLPQRHQLACESILDIAQMLVIDRAVEPLSISGLERAGSSIAFF